jgi:hypothetical protein
MGTVLSPEPKGQQNNTDKGAQVTESFGAIERRPTVETASMVLAAQAKASVEARYIVALQRPRDMDVVRQKILKDCERPAFAKSARYTKPVGGSTVSGLNIRFVESALRHMGNVLTDPAIIFDDEEKRIVRVTVTDLETNATYSKDLLIEKTVERKQLKQGQQPLGSRLNSKGDRVYLVGATEDDMAIKEAALMSKAIRQLGLRIIPGDIQEESEQQVLTTLRDKAAKDPDAEKREIIDAFDDLGVRVEQLKKFLGFELESITPKDLVTLRGVYQAIRDGETNWREVMEQRESARGGQTEEKSNKTAEVLKAINKNKSADKAPEQAPKQDATTAEQQATPTEKAAEATPESNGADQVKGLKFSF